MVHSHSSGDRSDGSCKRSSLELLPNPPDENGGVLAPDRLEE